MNMYVYRLKKIKRNVRGNVLDKRQEKYFGFAIFEINFQFHVKIS